jgi:hypothetical protein
MNGGKLFKEVVAEQAIHSEAGKGPADICIDIGHMLANNSEIAEADAPMVAWGHYASLHEVIS